MYTIQGKPDQHVTYISRSVRVWSYTIRISRGQCIVTFRESPIDLDGFHQSREKGIFEYIPSTPTDRPTALHPVSLILSIKEVVGLSQASVSNRLLCLLGSYHQYAIDTFNTYSWGQPIGP
jgi:hypothetical protein